MAWLLAGEKKWMIMITQYTKVTDRQTADGYKPHNGIGSPHARHRAGKTAALYLFSELAIHTR